jgi:hypothetical protein
MPVFFMYRPSEGTHCVSEASCLFLRVLSGARKSPPSQIHVFKLHRKDGKKLNIRSRVGVAHGYLKSGSSLPFCPAFPTISSCFLIYTSASWLHLSRPTYAYLLCVKQSSRVEVRVWTKPRREMSGHLPFPPRKKFIYFFVPLKSFFF